jgi:hypothetical protein
MPDGGLSIGRPGIGDLGMGMTPPLTCELPEDALRGFPEPAEKAVRAFAGSPDRATLDAAVRALLEYHLPRAARRPLAGLPGTIRLREDLGIDSLTLTEAIFKWDDLFGTAIETRDAAGVRTLDDLLEFLADKMGLDVPTLPGA